MRSFDRSGDSNESVRGLDLTGRVFQKSRNDIIKQREISYIEGSDPAQLAVGQQRESGVRCTNISQQNLGGWITHLLELLPSGRKSRGPSRRFAEGAGNRRGCGVVGEVNVAIVDAHRNSGSDGVDLEGATGRAHARIAFDLLPRINVHAHDCLVDVGISGSREGRGVGGGVDF